jgi:hypothetical protein
VQFGAAGNENLLTPTVLGKEKKNSEKLKRLLSIPLYLRID